MYVKDVILILASLGLIGAGTVLVAAFFLGFPGVSGDSVSEEEQEFKIPVLEEPPQVSGKGTEVADAPEDETLVVTIPKMARMWGALVQTGEGDEEEEHRQDPDPDPAEHDAGGGHAGAGLVALGDLALGDVA